MDITVNKDLIVKAQSGDAYAFEALVNHYYETMFKIAFKFCGNRQNAEDITQESCIRLARGLHTYRHDATFTTWLYRLVLNTGKDYFRKNRRYKSADDEELIMEITKSEEPAADEQLFAKQVIAAVEKLPETEREAVFLVMVEGMTHKQAAEVLDCQEGTVSWRIHEARKKLNALFDKEQKYG
jgi:RNA polymerase sigma-70 factor (ECF subfamily)